MVIHVIRSGETLWSIANAYHVSVEALIMANSISDPNRLAVGQTLVIPTPSAPSAGRPTIEVNAYTYQPSAEAVVSIQELSHLLTAVIPFTYHVSADGNLDLLDDQDVILAAKQHHIIPLMAIANFSGTEAGGDVAHTLFTSPEIRERLLENIIRVLREKGYRGLNVDFENVRDSDREGYNQFLERAVAVLHPLGYSVSTAVMPKTAAVQPGPAAYAAYDYEAQGKIVDFIILMTYEWGYRSGPPQAISPVHQMRRVVEYAVSVIPVDKISLGFETYARDWVLPHVQGQEAETFSPSEAVDRAIQYGADIHYDTQAQSPFFRYTDEQGKEHEVWFEDARSAQAKFDLVKEFKLRGISYWALGFPYSSNWVLLEENFNVLKHY